MEKFTIDATEDNVLESIKNDYYGRSNDIKDFVTALDMIEGNMFISLDARWGEGKTFYVRQVEQTLKYHTAVLIENDDLVASMKPYFMNNAVLKSISLSKAYLPLYYNAWLYDDHDDPLMSLLFVLIKEVQKYVNTKLDNTSLFERVIDLFNCLSFSFKGIQANLNSEVFKSKDILESIKTADEIRSLVKKILDEIIIESAEKLVIFIDELDRCRPDYAIKMLERIKHYYDDEHIIFVLSINKEQLIHTINQYYGAGFNATAYLNKFFDMTIHLPVIKNGYKSPVNRGIYGQEQYRLREISKALIEYYNLSLRDGLIFMQRVIELPVLMVHDYSTEGALMSMFVPIIIALDIVDAKQKDKFLHGYVDLFEQLTNEIPVLYEFVCRYSNDRNTSQEERYKDGLVKIKEVYQWITSNGSESYAGRMDINSRFKENIIRLCNGFIQD